MDIMSRYEGPSSMSFTPNFFKWLHMELIMIEEYPYAGMYFCRDPELMLPDGE